MTEASAGVNQFRAQGTPPRATARVEGKGRAGGAASTRWREPEREAESQGVGAAVEAVELAAARDSAARAGPQEGSAGLAHASGGRDELPPLPLLLLLLLGAHSADRLLALAESAEAAEGAPMSENSPACTLLSRSRADSTGQCTGSAAAGRVTVERGA